MEPVRRKRKRRGKKRQRIAILAAAILLLAIMVTVVVWKTARKQPAETTAETTGGTTTAETTAAETTAETLPVTEATEPAAVPATSPATEAAAASEEVSFDKSELEEWYLKVASPASPVEEDFAPPQFGKITSSNGTVYKVDARILEPLRNMIAAAKKDGVTLTIISAYRSYSYQTGLFNKKVQEQEANGYSGQEAQNVAATIVARPGTSEHQLGLALDFNYLSDRYADSAELTWLRAHGPEYGFILRYEKSKEEITGVIYEPWHFRYVTPKHAKEITRRGITLDEYVKLFH